MINEPQKGQKRKKERGLFFIIMQEKNRQSALSIQAKRIINYIQVEYSFFGYKIFFFSA